MTSTVRSSAIHDVIDRLAGTEALDQPAEAVAKVVRDTVQAGAAKDALSGVWLGHALHPLLTDLPIGTYTSAVLLDWLGGKAGRTAADRLIGLGLLFTVPTAATGLTEWADSEAGEDEVRRVGIVHAALNVGATVVFGASLAARKRGSRGMGKLLGLAGLGLLGASGQLGGHLSYAEGIGVDQTTFQVPPEEWCPALPDVELPEGEARAAEAGGIAVVLARHEGAIHALSDRCSHRGGPLHEGELRDGCITCPWHYSVFKLEDGSVVQGPAAYPQPRWETRVRDGMIEIKGA